MPSMDKLPATVRPYFDGVAHNDIDVLMSAFRPDAKVRDVDRDIVGEDRIRAWAMDEVLGGRYEFHEVRKTPRGCRILLTFQPKDEPQGFRAVYDITATSAGITGMDLQYA